MTESFLYPARNIAGEYGLAITKRKFLLKIVTADSYLATFQHQSALQEEDSFFLPFLKTLNHHVQSIPVEKKSDLRKIEILESSTSAEDFPAIAFNKNTETFGIVFETEPQFGSLMSEAEPFFNLVHNDFESPLPEKDELLFLSLPMMVKKANLPKDILQKVNRRNIEIFQAPVLKRGGELGYITDKLNKVSFTPAAVVGKNGNQSSSTLPASEGLTTIATKSTCLGGMDDSFVHSMDVAEIEDLDGDNDLVELGNEKEEMLKPCPIEGYPEPSDSEREILSNIRKSKWVALRCNLEWKLIWLRGRLLENIEAFIVPKCLFDKDEKIQNLDYFVGDDFFVHLHKNPWLTEEWWQLWSRLQKIGWIATPYYIRGKRQSCYQYGPAKDHTKELLWGTHKFSSKLALTQYIARFPYLIQETSTFSETLKRFKFEVDKRAEKVKVNGKWTKFSEFREICWVYPAKLFMNIAPTDKLQERIMQSLSLSVEYAAEEDMEPSSPEVDGMSTMERDRILHQIYTLAERSTHAKWNAERFHELILNIGWEYAPAEWSNKWWKFEMVYTSPYCNKEEVMCFGRDYFFTIQDVAAYISIEKERTLTKPNKPPQHKEISNFTNFDRAHYSLEKRVQQIAINHDTNEAFTKFRLRDMLRELGYEVFQDGKKWVYIPPHSVHEGVNKRNYKQNELNTDYFVSEQIVLDRLTRKADDSGNLSCPSSPGAESTVSSLSTVSSGEKKVVKSRQVSKSSGENESMNSKQLTPQSVPPNISTSQKKIWGSNPKLLSPSEYNVYEAIHSEKPIFGRIYIYLKQLGWDALWVAGQTPVICTGRMLDAVGKVKGKSITRNTLKLFQENIDFFYETAEGKENLLNYIKINGVNQTRAGLEDQSNLGSGQKRVLKVHTSSSTSPKIEIPQSVDVVKKRSPMKALYKAGDPSLHYDRLLTGNVLTPEAEEEQQANGFEQLDGDDHASSVNLFNSNYFDYDDDYVPTYLPDEENSLIPPEYRQDLIHLLGMKPLIFERIVKFLRQIGWSWDYGGALVSKIYFCPGYDKKSANLKLNENYFTSENALLQFLRKLFGLSHEEILASNEKPRQTRSGRELTKGMDVASDVSVTNQSHRGRGNPKRKRGESIEELSIAESEGKSLATVQTGISEPQKPKRFRLQPATTIIETRKEVTLLKDVIAQALDGLQVFTDFNNALPFPLPERPNESKQILTAVLKAVRSGRGNCLYLCGNTGTGKSLTANAAVKYAESYVQQHCDASYGNMVTFRFNASSVSKESLLEVMCPRLDVTKEEDISHYMKSITPLELPPSEYEVDLEGKDEMAGSSSMEKLSPSKRRGRPARVRPMVVIIVDELDTATPLVWKTLMDWALGNENSGCLLIGTGNVVNFLSGVQDYHSKPKEIIFPAYTNDDLLHILTGKVKNLFADNAKKFLVSKMISNDKGNIRALFQNAKKILESAIKDLTIDELNEAPKEVVNLSKARSELQQADHGLEVINALSAPARNLLAIMILHGLAQPSMQFAIADAMRVYNVSFEQSNNQLPKLEHSTICVAMQNLVDSSLLELLKKKNGNNHYKFSFDTKKLLQSTTLPEFLKQEVKIYLERENQEEKENLMDDI